MDVDTIKTAFESSVLNKFFDTIEEREEIHITDLTNCLRKSYYVKKIGFKTDYKGAYRMLIGTLLHDSLLQLIAEKLKGKCEVELELHGIKGRADLYVDSLDTVIELKIVSKIPFSPYETHVEQVNFYAYALNCDYAYVLYVDRRTGETQVYEVTPCMEILHRTLDKRDQLKEALENNKAPNPNLPLHILKIYCRSCPYKEICNSE